MATLIGREWAFVWSGSTAYAMRTAYGLLLLTILVANAFSGLDALAEDDPDEWAARSAALFRTTAISQFALLVGSAIVFFPYALLREKEQRTMDLLLMSPLRGAEILLAKTAGALLGFGVLMLAGVPVLMLLMLTGGLSTGELLSVHLVAFGTLLIAAAICTLLSAWSSKASVVMFWAFAMMGAYLAAPWAGPILVPSWAPAWTALEAWNPASILVAELDDVGMQPGSIGVFVAGALLLLVSCGVGGLALYGRHARAQERRSPWRWVKRIRSTVPNLLRLADPIARREVARASRPLFLLSALVFLVLGTATVVHFLNQKMLEEYAMLAICFQGVAVALMTLVGAATDAGDRRQDGSLELLLGSSAEPSTIVKAMLAAALFRSLLLMSVPAVLWAAYLLVGYGFWGMDFVNPWLVAPAMIAAAITAVFVGTSVGIDRRSRTGAVLEVLAAGPPIVLAVFLAMALNAATCAIALMLWVPAMRWLYAFSANRLRAGALAR